MVAYNGVHVVVWWCDGVIAMLVWLFACSDRLRFWVNRKMALPENYTINFTEVLWIFGFYCQLETALHDTQETWQTFSFRYYIDFWDLCYKIPEKEQPTGVIGQWFPKATGINQSPRQLHLDNGPQSLIWVAKCAYIFLDRRSSMIKSSELSLSSRT